ncbi:MAG: hypothetical protein U0872_12395 [Planctomycetaceae bacterium]
MIFPVCSFASLGSRIVLDRMIWEGASVSATKASSFAHLAAVVSSFTSWAWPSVVLTPKRRSLPTFFGTESAFAGTPLTVVDFKQFAFGGAGIAHLRTEPAQFASVIRGPRVNAAAVQQRSAQSRASRMHPAILATFGSSKHAFAHDSQEPARSSTRFRTRVHFPGSLSIVSASLFAIVKNTNDCVLGTHGRHGCFLPIVKHVVLSRFWAFVTPSEKMIAGNFAVISDADFRAASDIDQLLFSATETY